MAELQHRRQPFAFPAGPYAMPNQCGLQEGAFPLPQSQACGVPPLHRAPLPCAPHQPQTQRAGAHSSLTHSLQQQAAVGGRASSAAVGTSGAPALGNAAAPPLQHSSLFAQAAPPQQAHTTYCPNSWHSYAQMMLSQQAEAAYGLPASCAAPAAPPAAGVPWPALQPQAGSYQLFQGHSSMHPAAVVVAPQQQQQQEQGQQPLAAAVATEGRRVRRRRPTARRSLINLFDAAAATDDASDMTDDSDNECDIMMSSQASADSSLTQAGFPGPFAVSPGTPYDGAPADALPSPAACNTPSPGSERGHSPEGTPQPEEEQQQQRCASRMLAPPPGDHMLPLQHLLMSERAQHLSSLEVKAIVYKVAADLAELHDVGILHRHVTIASVALSRSGNLATARLMGHPYNVEAGAGRRYTGGKKAGVDAYLAPEMARCPADCVAYTPAGDLWSLGIVLFVLLSGSHVPFGNRGLCWTSIPNMPGPQESVDKLQRWLEEHLLCKLGVINQLRRDQEKGKAPLDAGPVMRVVGLDDAACDLLMRLLSADPAARPTARQVLAHTWLAEVESLMRSPKAPAPTVAAAAAAAAPFGDLSAPSPGFEARLHSTASDLASLGFSPATPHEEGPAAAGTRRLLRRESTMSIASSDGWWPSIPSSAGGGPSFGGSGGGRSGASSAAASSGCLVELPVMGSIAPAPAAAASAGVTEPAAAAAAAGPRSLVLGNGTSLQLLDSDTVAALIAGGLLPDLGSSGAATAGFATLGYAVQPVEVKVEGRRLQLSALHAVFNVNGQPMLCAQPVAVTQQLPLGVPLVVEPAAAPAPPHLPARGYPPSCATTAAAAPGTNPDFGTSAPILPLLARMLQQQQ